jgi:hypothetical protein
MNIVIRATSFIFCCRTDKDWSNPGVGTKEELCEQIRTDKTL